MLMAAGVVLLALGFLLGALLVLGPLGFVAIRGGTTPVLLFTLLVACGWLLAALAARLRTLPLLARAVGGLLLLLSVGAACALALRAAGLLAPGEGTPQLWWVFAAGGLFGALSLLAHRPAATT